MATKDGKKTGGRKAGKPNKRTEDTLATFARLKFSPVEELIRWARGDWEALGLKTETKLIGNGKGQTIEIERINEELRKSAARDLLPFFAPMLKSVEFKGDTANNLAQSFAQLMAGTAEGISEDDDEHKSEGTTES